MKKLLALFAVLSAACPAAKPHKMGLLAGPFLASSPQNFPTVQPGQSAMQMNQMANIALDVNGTNTLGENDAGWTALNGGPVFVQEIIVGDGGLVNNGPNVCTGSVVLSGGAAIVGDGGISLVGAGGTATVQGLTVDGVAVVDAGSLGALVIGAGTSVTNMAVGTCTPTGSNAYCNVALAGVTGASLCSASVQGNWALDSGACIGARGDAGSATAFCPTDGPVEVTCLN
jgi:hypothetical protein